MRHSRERRRPDPPAPWKVFSSANGDNSVWFVGVLDPGLVIGGLYVPSYKAVENPAGGGSLTFPTREAAEQYAKNLIPGAAR